MPHTTIKSWPIGMAWRLRPSCRFHDSGLKLPHQADAHHEPDEPRPLVERAESQSANNDDASSPA